MGRKKVLISAGGTKGHIFPAEQLAEILLKEKICDDVLFAAHNLDRNKYFTKRFKYKNVLSKAVGKNIFSFLFAIIKGFFQAWKLLNQYTPQLVIGFGSYHTFPVLLATRIRKIPYILFESNTWMGRVNRFFAKKAYKIASQLILDNYQKENFVFVDLLPWIRKKNVRIKQQHFTLLIFGGSQGSKYINELALSSIKKMLSKAKQLHIIHLVGDKKSKKMVKDIYDYHQISYEIKDYVDDMNDYFLKADMVICRSGALSLSELIYYQIPALLIPFPYASEDHQKKNALFFQNIVKGGYIHNQGESIDLFIQKIYRLFDEKERADKRKNLVLYNMQQKKRTKMQTLIRHTLEKKI